MKALSALSLALAGVACADELAVLRAPQTVQFAESNSIQTTDVADLLSQSLGLPSLSAGDAVHARQTSLRAPRAAVLFVADGLDMDKKDYTKAVAWRDVEAGDMDSVATLVSAVSGKMPSEHLIPARLWVTSLGFEHAFSLPTSFPAVGNVADMLTQLFDESVTVSMSGDKQFAMATAPHPTVAEGKSYVYSWEEQGFEPQYKSFSDLSLAKEDIISAMPEFIEAVFPTAKFCPKMKTVSIDGTVFDLNNQADLKFFAEMVAVRAVMKHMEAVATGRIQAHPDFFSFGMSALPALKLQYGADSKQFKTAQAMYTRFLAQIADEFMSVYNNDAVVTLLGLDERADSHTVARRQAAKTDPYAACTGSSTDPDYCAYGPNHAVFFQIFFWLSLMMIVATWMTIYSNANMDIKDSIIFRMTSMPRFKTE